MKALFIAAALQMAAVNAMATDACTAASGAQTAALVELYTSEGCSSCPPADRWLASLPGPQHPLDKVVPIALHVPYWDYIGWKDALAKPEFAARHSWLTGLNGHRTVYTPHFFVSGKELRGWGRQLDAEILRINARPARARVEIRAERAESGVLAIRATAASPLEDEPLQLFLAVTEDRITSHVRAGENRGVTLHHAHVARAWIGPLALTDGRIATRQTVSLDPAWNPARLGVVGFVQNGRTGEVLQAVAASRCGST